MSYELVRLNLYAGQLSSHAMLVGRTFKCFSGFTRYSIGRGTTVLGLLVLGSLIC